MPQPNGTSNKTSLMVNDGEGVACEHCRKAKDDVIALTVGDTIIFISLECFNDAASLAVEEGKFTVLV